ncbi:MAG: hypothetical protein LCH46_14625 [Proteobacteria bacterium]|nr:hypothetical protein [Pseudomonadota bacterium]
MVRNTLFILAILGSAATAIASIAPKDRTATAPSNITVIAKNQAFPMVGALEIDECQVEDCSDE